MQQGRRRAKKERAHDMSRILCVISLPGVITGRETKVEKAGEQVYEMQGSGLLEKGGIKKQK